VFDVDGLVADCVTAARDSQPLLAVRDVLRRALADPSAAQETLPATRAELTPLYQSDELTVLKVVWAPGMWIQPHDHRMWAAIGIYGGREDNSFFRREGTTIVESGDRTLETSDVALLGDDVVHAVANPLGVCTGAIHVYGGDFFGREKDDWDPVTLELQTDKLDRSQYFEEWNERLGL
jgi:predicted metal-dependent enzyme (double-stranded beta helix superfamily)